VRVWVLYGVERRRKGFPLEQFPVRDGGLNESALVVVECLRGTAFFLGVTKCGRNRHHHVLHTFREQGTLHI